MKSKLSSFLQDLSPRLYQFAYLMVPDDLQAQQIVIDACSSFLLQEDYLEDFWLVVEEKKTSTAQKHFLFMTLIPQIYELALKRASQLGPSLQKQQDIFYQLEISQRALLYLHLKRGYSYQELAELLQIEKNHVIEKLYSAKKLLFNLQDQGVDQTL